MSGPIDGHPEQGDGPANTPDSLYATILRLGIALAILIVSGGAVRQSTIYVPARDGRARLEGPTAGSAAPTPSAIQGESKLDRILQISTLNRSVGYVENILGRAKHISAETRVYSVDGCDISITYDGGAVANVGIEGISQRCNFPLERFLQNYSFGDLRSLTLGKLSGDFGGNSKYSVAVRCVNHSCGKLLGPYVDFYRYGGYSDRFIDVSVSTHPPYRDAEVANSLSRFEDNARSIYDLDDTPNTICEENGKYIDTFSNLLVKNVYVGWKIDGSQGRCE
jgi:hypothetical protein